MSRAGALVLAAALAACSAADGPAPAADSTVVAALAEVQLADARAALDTLPAAPAESLRAAALDAHGWTPADLEAALDALAADPDLAKATYDAVDVQLGRERQGVGP